MVGALELLAGYLMAFFSVPWIELPVEEIELTLFALTSLRNVGEYGIWTRGFGPRTWEETQKFRASSATMNSSAIQRGFLAPFGGLAG